MLVVLGRFTARITDRPSVRLLVSETDAVLLSEGGVALAGG